MLDPNEFLSEYGIRSLSKYHKEHPYRLLVHDEEKVVNYEPAESQTAIFGGNSNWRGPVWFPVNYLADRVAPAISSLLRRRLQSGMPDRFWHISDVKRNSQRTIKSSN